VLCSALAENRIDVVATGEATCYPYRANGSPSVIDFGISKGFRQQQIRVNVLTELSSDHLPLLFELDEDAQLFRSVTKMLSPQANIRIFIEATVELNILIDTCNRLEAYIDYFKSAIIEAARQATPPPHQVGLTVASHNKHRGRQYLATGDSSIYQQYSSTTNRLRCLLANNRKANLDTLLESAGPDSNSGFSIWKLMRGIKRQPLFQSPIQDRGGNWLKTDYEKESAFASHLCSTFMPFNLTEDTNRETIVNFWILRLLRHVLTAGSYDASEDFATQKHPWLRWHRYPNCEIE